MTHKFVVIDEKGNTSYSAKDEGAESFKSFAAAEKRAKELAETSPGEIIGIYERTAYASADVLAAATTKLKQ